MRKCKHCLALFGTRELRDHRFACRVSAIMQRVAREGSGLMTQRAIAKAAKGMRKV